MMDLKTFAVDIARGVYANDEKFALVELQGLWTEIQKKANVEPPVDLRAAVRQLVDDAIRIGADGETVIPITLVDTLIDRISAFVAERELARDERAAAMFRELYNCYTASKCAAGQTGNREEFLRLKGMAEAYQDAEHRILDKKSVTSTPENVLQSDSVHVSAIRQARLEALEGAVATLRQGSDGIDGDWEAEEAAIAILKGRKST